MTSPACESCKYWKAIGDTTFSTKVGFQTCTRVHTQGVTEAELPPVLRNNKHDSDDGRLRYWSGATEHFASAGTYIDASPGARLMTHKSFVCGRYLKA